jgi:tetrahydromethanopterin S-methyltransferase subunit B
MSNATTATGNGTISPKQYQIHNSLDRMQDELDRLEALRNDLYFRLDTVMRPTEPCPSLEGAKVGSGVPLCLRIDDLTDRIAANNDALKDILDRLEV